MVADSGIAFTSEDKLIPGIMGKTLDIRFTLKGNLKENFQLPQYGLNSKTGIMLMVPCRCYGISVLFIHIKRAITRIIELQERRR